MIAAKKKQKCRFSSSSYQSNFCSHKGGYRFSHTWYRRDGNVLDSEERVKVEHPLSSLFVSFPSASFGGIIDIPSTAIHDPSTQQGCYIYVSITGRRGIVLLNHKNSSNFLFLCCRSRHWLARNIGVFGVGRSGRNRFSHIWPAQPFQKEAPRMEAVQGE